MQNYSGRHAPLQLGSHAKFNFCFVNSEKFTRKLKTKADWWQVFWLFCLPNLVKVRLSDRFSSLASDRTFVENIYTLVLY
ncbi:MULTISPECIES: hypothetical protein [Fischerella]|uniref:Uncharacterized protein n=1 Tax=Fischerella muscicola CCMEE 5323 TaxID=2019572 RepID=A0A2N6JUY3_FISMU|nr:MULTISPECIES: hypothetical protein [Fischerella]MBD2430678.1 hypothetical protein [Fischerella sp. FACHB-380]PLZ82226.1 hypothetical protein CEN44_27930 [Fischerella muscicola CCMEE 5323]